MSEDEKEEGSIQIRSFLLNKKERYEYDMNRFGEDGRLTETESLIEAIKKSKNEIYERRKNVIGFDFIYAEGKIIALLSEVFNVYCLGMYYSAIATCSMAAERLCYDFLDFLEIKFGNKLLDDSDKELLAHIPLSRLIELLLKINIVDEESKTLLFQIIEIRNRYIHPKATDADTLKNDALKIVNLLCRVLESRLSMFRFYELVDGKFIRKPDVYFDS